MKYLDYAIYIYLSLLFLLTLGNAIYEVCRDYLKMRIASRGKA